MNTLTKGQTEFPMNRDTKSDAVELQIETVETSNDHVGAELATVLPKHDKPWYLVPSLLYLNMCLAVLMLSATTMGFDGSMMNGLQSLQTWNDYFGQPSGAKLGVMNAALFLGVFAAFPAAWMSDTVGRRYTMMFGIVLLTTGAAVQGASKNVNTFIASRFVVGIGNQFASLPAPALLTELAYPAHRGRVTSLYYTNFYNNTWSWRIPSLLQALLPVIQIIGLLFVPESPRWLISKGKLDRARAILTKYHAAGQASHPVVDFEMQEIQGHIEKEKEQALMGWSGLWRTKADRKRLSIAVFVIFIAQFSGNFVITYYLSLVLESAGIHDSFTKTLINGILQIFNFFAAMAGSLAVDRLGRRTLWLWSIIGMLITYIIFTACSGSFAHTGNKSTGTAVVAFIFIFFFHYDIAVTPFTYAYPTEILPFHARQKGLAVVNFASGCFLIFNSFVNAIAMEAIGWKYYIVFVAILSVILVVVYLFFAETKGLPLEEIPEIFEGPSIVSKRARRYLQRRDS